MPRLVPSRYNIFVPLRSGRVLAYNSMSGASAIWDRDEYDAYEGISSGRELRDQDKVSSSLLYGGYVVRDGTNELLVLRQEYERQRFDRSGFILTIAPTLACNFGCDYCFQGCDKPKGEMLPIVQDKIVDLVQRVAPQIQRMHIGWYGGEPLLAFSVIESLSRRMKAICEANSVQYDAMIVTNGYKLKREIALALVNCGVRTAQITLDGAPRDHDRRRTLLGGQPTFARILENLCQVIDLSALQISIRINIDARNSSSVRELLDQLRSAGLSNKRNFGVYFAPVEAITEGCHSIADVCMTKSDYARLEVELTRYAFEAGLARLPYPGRFRGLCGAVKPNGFVLLPNGDLHKCWDTVNVPSLRVGTIFDLAAVRDNKAFRQWMRWSPFDNPICQSCKLLPSCAGSCAHKFVNSLQTLGEAGVLPCPSWKYNIKERLILFAERSGQITSADFDLDEIRTDPSEICDTPHSRSTLAVSANAKALQASTGRPL